MRSIEDTKAAFFDRTAVMNMVNARSAQWLSALGAYVMESGRGMIRPKKKPSKPGTPPRNITGLLRDKILFSYEPPTNKSNIGRAIIGPAALDSPGIGPDGTPVPALLEYGGLIGFRTEGLTIRYNGAGKRRGIMPSFLWVDLATGVVVEKDFEVLPMNKRFKLRNKEKARWEKYRTRTMMMKARPYMRPALNKVIRQGKIKQLIAAHANDTVPTVGGFSF